MKLKLALLAFGAALLTATAGHSQTAPDVATVVANCGTPPSTYTAGSNRAQLQNTAGNLCTAASVSASITGFAPATTGTAITATTGGDTGSLPAGAVVVVSNIGTSNNAYCKLGASATVADQLIAPNSWFAYTVGAATQLTCITSSSTTTVNMVGGSGLPTGAGGGGGGSGSNAAASATGSAVPASGSYSAVNVGGTLRGQTGVNPTGTVYAPQTDLSSVAGTVVSTGAGAVGTGTARVAVGQDTTTVAGAAPTTTGIYVTGPAAAALATSVNQSSVIGTKAAGTAAASALLTGGVYNSTPPTVTNGQQVATQVSAAGRLLVDAAITGGGDATAANQTVIQGVIGAATAPTKMNAVGGVYNSTPLTLTNGQSSALQLDANGYLDVNVKSATGVAQGSTTSGQSVSPVGCRTLTSAPTDTTAQTNMPWCRTNGTQAQDIASINGTTVSTGTGAQGSGTPRVTVATDTATLAGSAPGTAGTASSNVVTVQGVASMTPVLAQPVSGTTGGATKYTLTAANSTNATNVKASAGTLYHVSVYNNSATLAWLSFYNTSGTPTCGTAIVYQVMIPANSTSGAGAVEDFGVGMDFSSGIGICVATGIAGTGSVAASAYVVGLTYK